VRGENDVLGNAGGLVSSAGVANQSPLAGEYERGCWEQDRLWEQGLDCWPFCAAWRWDDCGIVLFGMEMLPCVPETDSVADVKGEEARKTYENGLRRASARFAISALDP